MKYLKIIEVGVVSEENTVFDEGHYHCPEEIANSKIVKDLINSDREKFICLHLNVKNKIINYEVVSIGSLNTSIVHPREVLKGAILSNSASVVFLHNHPSGDPEPSIDDIEITERLCKSFKILGINVLDHIIVAEKGYFSFKEKKMI